MAEYSHAFDNLIFKWGRTGFDGDVRGRDKRAVVPVTTLNNRA